MHLYSILTILVIQWEVVKIMEAMQAKLAN